MGMLHILKQLFCEHELMLEDGMWKCIHCLKVSEVSPIAPAHSIPLSSRDITELYDFLLTEEMSLHGGG